MARETAAIILGRRKWQLLAGKEQPEQVAELDLEHMDASEATEQLSETIRSRGLKSVAILLETDLCYQAEFSLASPRHAGKRSVLLYKLEEELPFPAEDLSACFFRQSNTIYAIAIEKDVLEAVADQLAMASISVSIVTPLDALAWQAHLGSGRKKRSEVAMWIDEHGEGNSVLLSKGLPVRWKRFFPEPPMTNVTDEVSAIELSGEAIGNFTIYCPSELVQDLGSIKLAACDATIVESSNSPVVDSGWGMLGGLVRREREPLVDLSRDLATRWRRKSPLTTDLYILEFAAAFLLTAVAAKCLWMGSMTGLRLKMAQRQQEAVWRETFPDQRLPANVRGRLESEFKKLSGVRGNSTDKLDASVLPTLYALLGNLPRDLRFRLIEFTIDDEAVECTGEVRDYADADLVAAQFRSAGFSVPQPSTRRLTEGVEFRLRAEPSAEAGVAHE